MHIKCIKAGTNEKQIIFVANKSFGQSTQYLMLSYCTKLTLNYNMLAMTSSEYPLK